MKYIVQDSEDKKMLMEVVGSMPQLPEGYEVLGLAEDLPEMVAEIEASSQSEQAKADARQFLQDTDWKVLRHRDQVDAQVTISLTSQEFTQLLIDRQTARDSI